jgi:cyclopropane fatty-acyl-phospholipid synthase-like methyltransferase
MANLLSDHFDWVSDNDAYARKVQSGFHAQLAEQLKHLIPEGSRVLEVGCGRGDLLRALRPKAGLGIEFSSKMRDYAMASSANAGCE